MDEPESRFSHLLQPIRDLTKNWEVDVAAQLGEYLDELDQICISFDGGKTTMNFAEAALLIQGSACIYSKKFLSLDDICNKIKGNVDMKNDRSTNISAPVSNVLESKYNFPSNAKDEQEAFQQLIAQHNSLLNAVPMEEVANPHIDSSSHDCPLPVLDLSAASGNDNGLNDTAVDRSFLPLAQDVEMNMDTSPQEHIETQKVQTTRDRYLLREQPLVLNKEKIEKVQGILFSNENGGVENNFDNEHENDIEALRHGDYPDVEEEIREERLSYEDLVQRNVELFIANSQKYAQETALSVRIKEWEDQMRPLLTEQEERIPFDIHDYGNKIVDAFNHVGERKLFASIVRDKEAFEVCRYMLASLQLANDYTVQIDQKPGLHEALDTMGLKLLSQQRAHERFKTYTAPSLSDN
ncbi:CNDH2 protein, partial [Polypterus senegalus]|nr:CNDH2 protein [Polypterus senegalus]